MPHPTADQLADAALPGTPTDPEVSAHLADCASCAAEVDALRRTVGHARGGMALDVAPPPPPEVWDGILDRLGDDAPDGARPRSGSRDGDAGPAPAGATRAPRTSARRLLLAGVAAVVAVLGVLVGVVLTSTPESAPGPAPIALVATRPGVVGEVVGGPTTMHVDVTLPEPAPAGAGLEVWDMSSGTPRALAALEPVGGRTHWAGELPLPPPRGMPPLDVSLQPAGSGPGHSGLSLAHTP